jgi:plastocyanin
MRSGYLKLAVVVTAVLMAGCGGGEEFELPQTPVDEPAGPAYEPASATATVSGRVVLRGGPPEMPFLRMSSDRYCQQAGLGLMSEEVVTSEDGGLRNVIVYVRSGHDTSLGYPAPAEPEVLDQQRCVYVPRVLTLMTGQELRILNSDAAVHNIHAEVGQETLFNFAQRSGPQEDVRTFEQPAMPLHIGCDFHNWMDAWLGIFDHPFHTTSADAGQFSLALPPGEYELVAWHERYGEQVATVTLSGGESAEIEFTFTAE